MTQVENSSPAACSNRLTNPALMKPSLLAALAAMLLAAPALATIYKYERPDGTVVYSDQPVKGARLVERFAVAQAPTPVERPQGPASAREASPPGAPSELDVADAQVRAAEGAVDQAKVRLAQGAEPLPGE